MTELIAKPIVKNRFWIITDGQKKVGNIEATGSGYGVNLNGNTVTFNTTADIASQVHVTFVNDARRPIAIRHPYDDIPTPSKVYNSVLDVSKGLHLFTLTAKSKCLHAAGWFVMKQEDRYEIQFCPKYIFIQRYEYHGPYKTEEEAREKLEGIMPCST